MFLRLMMICLYLHQTQGACPKNCKLGQACQSIDLACPECEQAYFGRYCQHRVQCRFSLKGTEYRGTLNTTIPGGNCQRWDSKTLHRHSYQLEEENYCRNPDSTSKPWCFTTDAKNRREYCDVPICFAQCPVPDLDAPFVDVMNPPSDGFAVGFTAVIGCVAGYEHIGEFTTTCKSNRRWTPYIYPTCTPNIKCLPPSLHSNSKIRNNQRTYKFQENVAIICDTGYAIQGESKLTCQANETWDHSPPICTKIECQSPHLNPNSVISNPQRKYLFQESVVIACSTGYTLQGQAKLTCQADKTWNFPSPVCKEIECQSPHLNPNSVISNPQRKYLFQQSVVIACSTGYTLQGQAKLRPTKHGTFHHLFVKSEYGQLNLITLLPSLCIISKASPSDIALAEATKWKQAILLMDLEIECQSPNLNPNSVISNPQRKYLFQESVVIACSTGYTLQGQAKLTCQADKTWNFPSPVCKETECPLPPIGPNNRVVIKKYRYNETIIVSCNEGYILQGHSKLRCQADKTWDHSLPACKEIECQSPALGPNSKLDVIKTSYKYKDTVTVVCSEGFLLIGYPTLTCQADKTWDRSAPNCIEIYRKAQIIVISVGVSFAVASSALTCLVLSRKNKKIKLRQESGASIAKETDEPNVYEEIIVNERDEGNQYDIVGD